MYHIRNRFRLLREYLNGKTRLEGRVLHLTIESTNHCNLKCLMCNRDEDPLPRGHMPLSQFRSIIEQTQETLEFVWPFGEGEPLLNRELFEMIAYCRQVGIRTALSTNATLLSEDKSLKLLNSGVDHVIFAFVGAQPITYERCCVGASFERTRSNIRRFLELKRDGGYPVTVILQTILLKETEDEIFEFKELWNLPGVDVFRFKEDQLKYSTLRARIYRPRSKDRPLPCFLLWRGPLFIRHDGTVIPCVRFAGRPPLGNLRSQTFDEFWNSTAMQDLREAHVRGDFDLNHPCRDCTIPRPTLPFTVLSFLVGPLVISRFLPYVERLHLFWRFPIFQDSFGSEE